MKDAKWGPAEAIHDIDWSQPWLSHVAVAGQAVLADWALSDGPLFASLNRVLDAPVQFVHQDALGPQTPYEAHVAKHDQVPTRDNLHDFFNALSWAAWPHAKSQFNRLHAHALSTNPEEPRRRGPVRDALTLLDENGAVLIAPDAIWRALRAHDWHSALVHARSVWQTAQLWLVGHALMQQLTRPRKGLTSHVWLMDKDINAWAWAQLSGGHASESVRVELDRLWAKGISADRVALKPFTPLPVLGVPGWWLPNSDPAFYADDSVFRPKRDKTTVG